MAALLENQLVFVTLIGLCGGLLAYALIYPLLSGEARAEKRLGSIATPTDRVASSKSADLGMRKKQVATTLKELEAKQKQSGKVPLAARIHQAGLTWSIQRFFLFTLLSAILIGGATFAIKRSLPHTALLTVVGAALPYLFILYLRNRRMKKFTAEFPNAVDVIVRGVKSGLPIADCLRIIATEAAEPVRSEFRHIVDIQTLGLSVADACAELYKRVPVTEANFFGIVIQIQQKTGGNLAEVLGGLSKVLRERRKMKGKIVAMSTEATASAGIIAALPFIVGILVFLSAPNYIELLWTREAGQKGLMFGAFWMTLGCLVMKKMINFDF